MAAQMLIEGIKTQKLAIGDKLPPERVIAQEMSLSRNTVREAIATLQILGILETRQSQGNFIINTVDENNYETFLSLIFNTDESPFALIDARIAFEPGAALFCSRTCSENDIKALSSRVDRITQALADDDIKTYRMEDQLFHLSIAQATRNSTNNKYYYLAPQFDEKPTLAGHEKCHNRQRTPRKPHTRTHRYFSGDCRKG